MTVYDEFPELPDDTYRPDYGFSEKINSKVIHIQYNEGFEKLVPIGKNYKTKEFSVRWGNMRYNLTDDPEAKEAGNVLYDFLLDHVDVKPFWFRKLPHEKKILVRATELSLTHSKFDLVDIACTLKEFKGFGDKSLGEEIMNGR